MDAKTWLQLVYGTLSWVEAYEDGLILASGVRADLSHLLPLKEE
jgi:hypothetical protein